MKILITGSAGMFGNALYDKLAEDHEVVGIDINQKADFLKVDLSNADLTIQKIKEISPELIIHCAAYTDVDGCEKDKDRAYKLNVEVTETVALAAKKSKSFLIYISTDFVFDGTKKVAYVEENVTNVINVYGETKLEGEKAIKEILDKYLIVRTGWLFGLDGKNFVDTIIKKAKVEKELKVVNDQFGSPTYTVDLAEAISLVISNQLPVANSHILNITNSGSCSWFEFAEEIIDSIGTKDVNIFPISSEELNRPAKRPKMSILDNSKFNQIYGKTLPNWKDALKRYITSTCHSHKGGNP